MSSINFYSYTSIGLLLLAAACGNKNQASPGPQAVPVVTHEVNRADAAYYDEYPAIVRALNEVELRAQVNGYITATLGRNCSSNVFLFFELSLPVSRLY